MTNLVAAAYLATNLLLNYGPVSCGVLTNLTGRYARYFDVRNACVVERAITCPVCGNVSTQQVDITDIYDHYQALRQSDLRIGTLLFQAAGGACRDAERTVVELKAENAQWKAGLVPPPRIVADTPIPIPAGDEPWVTKYPPEEGLLNCDLIRDADVAIRCWRELAISGQIPYHRGVLTEAWTFVHWWGSPAPVCTYKSFVGCPTPPPHYGQNKSQAAIYERFIGEDREVRSDLTKETQQ